MQRQRAVDQIAAVGGQRQGLQIGVAVDNLIPAGHLPRLRQHPLGDIKTGYLAGSLLLCPAAKPAVAAAEIHHPQTGYRRQHCLQGRPLRCAFQPLHRAIEGRIAGKKLRVVINILAHIHPLN